MKNNIILKAENISASYGKKQVLWDISLDFTEGDFICLIGPNGCGKSTFMEVLCGISIPYLNKTEGNIFFNDSYTENNLESNFKNINTFSTLEKARHISFLPQSEQYAWSYSVEEIVEMGRFAQNSRNFGYGKEDKSAVIKALDDVGIEHLATRNFFELSGGN